MFTDILVMFVVLLLTWFAIFRWKRRRLYKLAAKFDGPPTLPFFGNALTFIRPKHKNLMKTAYAGVFKYQSPIKLWIVHNLFFYVYDPVNFETILNSPHALEKQAMYKFVNAEGETLFNANVPIWRKHKKLITPTFNQKILDGFVKIFSKQANILVDKLEKHAGMGIFDVYRSVHIFTVKTISESTLGHEIREETVASNLAHWTDTIFSVLCSRITANLLYYYDFTFKMTKKGKEYSDAFKYTRIAVQKIIDKKQEDYERVKKENYEVQLEEEATQRNAFLPKLIELSDKGKGLTDSEILEEVALMIMAGSDTSATMNSYIFMMLGMHPEIQEKVYKEVIDTVGLDRPIEYTDLQDLSYTELVVKETMRILPVGPMVARAATGDIELKDGRVIPEGASIVFAIIHAHRNPEYWPDPLKFDPLRFLPEECAKRHRYCFVPFAGGPRKCIGIQYAMMSMKVTVATMVRKYFIKTCHKQPKDIKITQHIASKPVDGFLISLEKRSSQ